MPEFDATVKYSPAPSLSEEFYRVGTDGSVWGCQKPGAGAGRAGLWRQRKVVAIGVGYCGVRLGIGGVHKTHYIHRLVLEAFVGPCPENMECRHLDGNRANNCLSNLCWGTRAENVEDKFRHGTQPMGSRIPWSKLTESDIPVIRSRLGGGEMAVTVARDYGVSDATVGDVDAGRTWKHVP